ncbi:Tn3 family transposase [Candidatus Poribacteria bacterium]|nr:Tn3 family transposase [Candidatus Poribacteria bacterium]
MPRMQILTPAEYATFETPPVFTNTQRQRFFDLSPSLLNLLTTFRTPTNQIGFVLTLGYFKAAKRFFARHFHEVDTAYVTKQLGFLPGVFDLLAYDEGTARRHHKMILSYLGFQPFSSDAKQYLQKEIRTMVRSQTRPKAILLHTLDILARRKTEIPSARTLTDLIIGEIKRHEGTLTSVIDAQVPKELRELLEALLLKEDASVSPIPQIQRFRLTLLKKISQSTRPQNIKDTLSDWQTLRELYDRVAPIIASLPLTHDGIRYYANSVIKSQVFQVLRRDAEDRHLHLVCFIAHQFYRLQDTLTDILLTVTQNALNTCQRAHKEQYYAARHNQRRAVHDFVDCVDSGAISPLKAIEAIAFSDELSDTQKVERIQKVLTDKSPQRNAAFEQLTSLKMQVQREADDANYYMVLAAQSRKLQNRLAELVKRLDFQGDETCELMVAIEHYKAFDGAITQTAPLCFLEPIEQQAVLDEKGAIRVSLYKVLLFVKIAQAIKGGALNLRHSYKYRSLDDYLIPKGDWLAHRDAYLQRADLTGVAEFQTTLHTLATRLSEQYHQTNEHILTGKNPHVHFRKDDSFYVSTPKAEAEESEPLVGVLPKRRYISLLEVLATVNRFTHFLDSFEPWRIKYTHAKPPPRTFFAGIVGYGCFIGTQKMASISSGIVSSELESTINGYFALDNIHDANDRIVQFMDGLALPDIYRQPDGRLHTSSDGLKFEVAEDCLHASYSFKYFGADKGVSAYTFIDMRQFLYHSLIISAAEHEAHYVIDGLMHNDVVKSDIHSTDTGGYSEILFGVMHLLGFAFAPRIKNFGKCRLYAFEKRQVYRQMGFRVLPVTSIKADLIAPQWDDILRFIATIKLKEATASQLFKRLNSYSRQHPLYQALKEFGKIPKSDFLLRYIDIFQLRQAVEKQLNKGENANKLSRAISFGNNQEFLSGEKVEQEIAFGCRRLIQNAIICWNYLYLTQKIAEAESDELKHELLASIRNGSVASWQHVNLHGEYDFSEKKLSDSVGLNAAAILAMKEI